MTFDNGVNGTMEPPLTHPSWDLLLIELVRDHPGADALSPELKNLLDNAVLFGVDDELPIEPLVSIGEDRRAHLGGPLRFFLWSFDGSSKCVATRGERLADGRFCEACLLLYLA